MSSQRGSAALFSASEFSMFESLEPRKLLSANLHSGTLSIQGSSKDDNIAIQIGDDGRLQVRVNKEFNDFDPNDVSLIRIESFRGDDNIHFDDENGPISITTRIYGAGGNDTIS